MYITMCQACAEKLRATHNTTGATAPHAGTCALCYRSDRRVVQYWVTAIRPKRHLPPRGLATKDRRARYRGNWRDDEEAES